MIEDRVLLCLVVCAFLRFITVSTNGNTIISGPFMQLEKPSILRLMITKPRVKHFIYCQATIDESFFYENDTSFFYTWYRNGNEVKNVWEKKYDFKVFQNGTLRLPVSEKASGEYRCKINGREVALISESITVVYPVLKGLQTSKTIKAFQNYSVKIECPVISEPVANVSWYFENVSLSNNLNNNSYILLANGSLIVRQASPRDEGKYKCEAHNQFVRKRKLLQFTLTLIVMNADSELSNSSNIVSQSSNFFPLIPTVQKTTQYISKGDNVTLRCYGINSSMSINWWFQSTIKDDLVKVFNDSTEYKFYADSKNQGFYTCSTPTDRQSFHVIVTEPPTIVKSLPSYETLITASLTFTCKTSGSPPPKITWYHNGAVLNSSLTRYINGNELVMHSFDPEEDGMYQCFARNVAGEVYSAAEVRFRNKGLEVVQKNPMKNIQCFPHSFNTINITFDSESTETMFILYIIQKNPHRWTAPFAPMKLNHTSYVVISSDLPIYRPFELITRVLFPTSEIRAKSKPQQLTIQSSLRSIPITCCTQGLLLHLVQLGVSSTFLTWSQPQLNDKKYFIVQFSIKHTQPHPKNLMKIALLGTTEGVKLNAQDIEKKLVPILPLDEETSQEILSRAEKIYIKNNSASALLESSTDIYSMCFYANVSGVALQNFTRIKVRVLMITAENENLGQDFRYVQWKVIENGTTEVVNTPFRLSIVESRMLGFHFSEIFNESCVEVCLWQIQFPIIHKEQPKCDQRLIVNSFLTVDSLKPTEHYRLSFFNCQSQILYGQLDVKTLPDPPGTISNQRIIRHNGLKLSWDPPSRPNGQVYYYNILWSLGNVTHEKNVPTCQPCSYKFPNLSESSKINVSIRVVGETGVGAPIFIDLRNINHHDLETEYSSKQMYSGIIIGTFLSFLCIFCFAILFIIQRRRFKSHEQVTIHLTSHSDANFGNLSNTGLPRSMALSGNSFKRDYFEMQTLIPKSIANDVLANNLPASENSEGLTSNSNYLPQRVNVDRKNDSEDNILKSTANISSTENGSNQRIIVQTPNISDHKFLCLSVDNGPLATIMQVQNQQSSLRLDDTSLYDNSLVNIPPKTLSIRYTPLQHSDMDKLMCFNEINTVTTANDYNSRKQYIPNYSSNSKQNDVIYLLAEEESISTLTPVLESSNMEEKQLPATFIPGYNDQSVPKTFKPRTESSKKRKNSRYNNNNNSSSVDIKKSENMKIAKKSRKSEISNSQLKEFPIVDSKIEESSFTNKKTPKQAATKTKATEIHNLAGTQLAQPRRPNLDPNG